jgi:putative tricarboxylic transport membrane protein
MDPLSGLIYGFHVALTPENLAAALIGALLGTAVGILPGLGPTTVIALLLIPTINLPPETGLIMLGGIYYGTQYGDSMTAILMNVPSEAPSVVIGLDGYEMAKQGRAGVALAVAAIGAWIGASVGLLGLVLLAGVLAPAALAIGPSEYFALSMVGLVILAKVSGGGTWKGLLALAIGLALPTVGQDPLTGFVRFSFGSPELMQGFTLVPVIMGLIGLSGILQLTGTSKTLPKPAPFNFREIFPSAAEWRESIPASLRGALIGFVFGILPGPGTVLSTFVSYRLERRLRPDRVGKGAVAAVAGPKAADDASVSGHLVPLMVLGIPFSSVTAILFAGILLHGIQPGPLLMGQHPEIFWGLVAAMYIGNLALLILNFPLVGMWMSILRIPQPILTALLVLLLLIGSYSLNNSFFDTLVLIGAGVLGYFLRSVDLDRTVVVLGLVLGPLVEKNFRLSLIISRGNPAVFFSTWIDDLLWLLLIVFFVGPLLIRAMAHLRPVRPAQPGPTTC